MTESDYYEIRFYHLNDVSGFDEPAGVYTLSPDAQAFSVWRVDNPTSSGMTQLRMRQMVGGSGPTRLFSHDAANNRWSLETGDGLRTLSRESVESGNERTRTTIISDPVYGTVSKTAETYRTYSWGEERIAEIRDPDWRALTTAWDYYDDETSDGWRYGRLKSRLDPNGHWEVYDYDVLGRRTKTISSWKGSAFASADNESLHRVQRIDYREEDLDGDGKREEIQETVEEIAGQEVSRRYRVEWGETFTEPNPDYEPGQPYQPPYRLKSVSTIRVGTVGGDPDPDDSANLTTTTHTYTSGPWSGKPRRVLHPNGTVTIYQYSRDEAGLLTTTVLQGEPTGSGEFADSLARGRMTVTQIDSAGNTLSETEKDVEEASLSLMTLDPPGGGGLIPEPEPSLPGSGANTVHIAKDPQGKLHFRVFDRTGQMVADTTETEIADANPEIVELQDLIDTLVGVASPDYIATLLDQLNDLYDSLFADLKDRLDGSWESNQLTATERREAVNAAFSLLGIADIDTGIAVSKRIVQSADEFGSPFTVSYPLDGTTETFVYGDFGEIASHTARDGTVTSNTVDALGRVVRTVRSGIAEEYDLDGNSRRRKTTRIGTDQSSVVLQESHYDLAGDLVWTKDIVGETTSYSEESVNGLWKRETGFPDGGTRIEFTYPDGALFRTEGTAAAHREYEYGINANGERWTKEILIGEGGVKTEWVTTHTDLLGRTVRREYADSAEEIWEYNELGQLAAHTDADGVTRRFAYNGLGEMEITAIAIDNPQEISFGGKDRIRRTTRRVLSASHPQNTRGEDIIVTMEEAWTQNSSDAPEIVSRYETTVNGLRSWEVRAGATSSVVTETNFSGPEPVCETRSSVSDGGYLIARYVAGRLKREARYGADDTLLQETVYTYDAHGRLQFADDLRNGRTTFVYDSADRLWKVTTPSPGPGQPAQTTEYGYDGMGRQTKIVHPDSTETHFIYWPNGQLKKTWGSQTYPVEYTHDSQGRKRTMTTWQNHSGESGAAVTTWNYHPQRGWLENKRYNDGIGPDYTYTPTGRLETRTWAREKNGQRLKTTYAYNEAGDLRTTVYSDDTPSVTHTYDRLGRLKTTEDAAGTLTRGYTAAGALEYEDYTGNGLLDGVSIDRGYDAMHRLRYLATDADYGVTYLFDSAGRLSEIAESHHRADFGYEPGTEILDSVTIRRVGIERLRHERSTDKLGRIEWVKTVVDGQTEVRRDYTYNSANQRTIVEHEDGRAWHYDYDDLGQVISAHKRLSADPQSAILPGYSFGYVFDDIGNRETATRNSRTANYTSNLLNQYDERDVPGYVDVLGEAKTTATVTVDGQSTQRTNRDFRREITVANSADPVYIPVEVEAEFDSQTVDETRHAFLPEDPEVFVHDADGNLISDGRWTYEWDGENRLKAVETITTVATTFPDLKQRLEFAYDHQGRRIQKIVKEWDAGSSAWQTAKDLRFVYDGWNLIEERDALEGDAVIRKHVWGLDLSGAMQGAGGVGGLLWTQTLMQTFAASSDANGNVVAWVNTATLAVAGRLDYSPFGEPLVQTGVAKELPFGFSSKYTDIETGLFYYGHRYLNSSTGRWLSQDPIEERGGQNLYGFVGNDSVNHWDYLGLISLDFIDDYIEWFADGRRQSRNSGADYGRLFMHYVFRMGDPGTGYSRNVWDAVIRVDLMRRYTHEVLPRDVLQFASSSTTGYGKFEAPGFEREYTDGILLAQPFRLNNIEAAAATGGFHIQVDPHDVSVKCEMRNGQIRWLAEAELKVTIDDLYQFTFVWTERNFGNAIIRTLTPWGKNFQIEDTKKVKWQFEF